MEAVHRIDALFDIERSINGQSAEQRRAVRQELSTPLVADLEEWLREQRPKLSRGNEEAGKGRPALEHVVHGFGEIVAARELCPLLAQPTFQIGDQRGA